jgi:hypothetical protein
VREVPSAIIEMDSNYLLNPRHTDFRAIRVSDRYPFEFDLRPLQPWFQTSWCQFPARFRAFIGETGMSRFIEKENAMLNRKSAALACVAAILALVAATSGDAVALVDGRTNHLTVSGPIGLPGVTLPGGTYTFTRLSEHADLVRVLSRDGSKVYFTGLTRRVPRPAGLSDGRTVTFRETSQGLAPRVNVWYPMAGSIGYQFIYPDATR